MCNELTVCKGLSIFLGGFLIWNLDNVFCSQVRQWRHAVGLPWAVLLEGHAWWHLMTGLGGKYRLLKRPLGRHCFPPLIISTICFLR